MTDATEKKLTGTGFYEAKGMIRRTVIFNKGYPEKLAKLAEKYGITQGDVIEVLLDAGDMNDLSEHFESRRDSKVSRLTKTELVKKMKGLTPEKLAAIEKILAGEPATD